MWSRKAREKKEKRHRDGVDSVNMPGADLGRSLRPVF